MALIHGKKGKVLVGTDAVLRVQNFNINPDIETVDAHSMGDDWKSHLTGFQSWSASISCLYDPADTTGQAVLAVGSEVAVTLYPGGDDTGSPEYSGTVTITSKPITVSKDGLVEVSFEGLGQGALTEGTAA